MTEIVLEKVLLAPAFIALATLAGRRWGPRAAGLIAGFPLTSGPVSFFLALDNGPQFAATAAVGTIAGLAAFVGFVWAYAAVARRTERQALALAGALAGYASVAGVLSLAQMTAADWGVLAHALHLISNPWAGLFGCGVMGFSAPLLRGRGRGTSAVLAAAPPFAVLILSSLIDRAIGAPLAFAALVLIVIAALRALPAPGISPGPRRHPWWDVPLRMAAAAAMVMLLTSAAAWLGAGLTGLLSPFPVFVTVMATFTHRHGGRSPTLELLRGSLISTVGFAAFFVAVAELATRGLPLAFGAAIAAALAVDAVVLVTERKMSPRSVQQG